jgi:hypothetical protein
VPYRRNAYGLSRKKLTPKGLGNNKLMFILKTIGVNEYNAIRENP